LSLSKISTFILFLLVAKIWYHNTYGYMQLKVKFLQWTNIYVSEQLLCLTYLQNVTCHIIARAKINSAWRNIQAINYDPIKTNLISDYDNGFKNV
jgi:hypothetical protein